MNRSSFLLSLAVILAAVSAHAQTDVEDRHFFGCSSTEAESTFDAELNHPSKRSLVPVSDNEEIKRAEAAPHHAVYSEIDSAKYKISEAEFFVRQDPPKDAQEAPPYSPLTIYVKLTSPDKALWWKVAPSEEDSNGVNESFLSAEVPNGEENRGQNPVTILPATGDRTVPIFDVQWSRQEMGVSVNSLEAHLLLDLRSEQPTAAADLACNSRTFFGVCGVWDNQMQDNNNYECDWVPGDGDFHCESRIWSRTLGKRKTKSWFHLLSGKEIPFAVPQGNPATLQHFAQLAEQNPAWRTRQAELPGLGKTSDVLRLAMASGRVIHILGTYGSREPFGAQFFYVILSKDAPVLGYIPAVSIFETDPEKRLSHKELEFQRGVAEQQALPTPSNQIETGTNLSFQSKDLVADARSHIYQITVTEDNGRDGNPSHAVYWLAVDEGPAAETLIGLSKLASDVSSYAGCARYASEDSAAVIEVLKGAQFVALIEVEPSHMTSEASEGFLPPDTENGENPEDQCPYTVRLAWNHKEWIASDRKTKCAAQFSPRIVEIGADGSIRSKPGEVQKPDSQ
jgi:hypothetical protein